MCVTCPSIISGPEPRRRDWGRATCRTTAWRWPCAAATLAPPVQQADRIEAGVGYAYHFDANLYAPFLRRLAQAAGVRRVEGRIVRAERDALSGAVSAVLLDDGRRVAGDLFVDCSGLVAAPGRDVGRAVRGLVAVAAVRPRRGRAGPGQRSDHAPTPPPSPSPPAGAGASCCNTGSATATSIPAPSRANRPPSTPWSPPWR